MSAGPGLQRKQGALGGLNAPDAAELADQAAPYGVFPGAAADHVDTDPISFAYANGGDVDVRARIRPNAYTGALQGIIVHRTTNNPTVILRLESSGNLSLLRHNDVLFVTLTSSAAVPSGTEFVRATSVQTGSAPSVTFTHRFYTSVDGVTWTELGTAQSATVADPMPNPSAELPVIVGANNSTGSSGPYTGRIYWAEIRDGVDGPVLARFDAAEAAKSPGAWWGDDGRAWLPEGAVTFEGVSRPPQGQLAVWPVNPTPSSFQMPGGALFTGVATAAVLADRAYYEPFEVRETVRLLSAQIHVATSGGTIARLFLARLGVNTFPTSNGLLWQTTVATDTTGNKTASDINLVLPPGRYMAGIVCNGAPHLRYTQGIHHTLLPSISDVGGIVRYEREGLGTAPLANPILGPATISLGSAGFQRRVFFRQEQL